LQQVWKMTEPEKTPIPPDLADAFHDAVVLLSKWRFGRPEPLVSFKMLPWPISVICELVTSFDESVPENIQHLLLRIPIELPSELPGFTYAAAARGCLKEIAARKARFEHSEKL
jgi:hypothetical protein